MTKQRHNIDENGISESVPRSDALPVDVEKLYRFRSELGGWQDVSTLRKAARLELCRDSGLTVHLDQTYLVDLLFLPLEHFSYRTEHARTILYRTCYSRVSYCVS